jgi:predicted transcriptional regulator
MKQVLLSITLLLCLSIGYAQVPGGNKKAVNTDNSKESNPTAIANELCECVNKSFSTFHPAIKQFIIDMAEKGADEAQNILEQKVLLLSEKEQEQINKDLFRMQDDSFSNGMAQCFNRLERLSDDVAEKVMAELEKSKNCKFLISLLQIGLDDE